MKLERFKQRELHGTVCLSDEYQLYSEQIRELERFWRLSIIRALLYRNLTQNESCRLQVKWKREIPIWRAHSK